MAASRLRTFALLMSTLAIATSIACTPSPRHAGAHVLRHGDLVVEVMEPDAPDRYNRGVRFTPIAAVLSARYDGVEYLFNPIDHDPIDDHAGLAAEFDLVTPDSPDDAMPPGYHDARPGEGFVKVGVGVLAKQKQRYSLFQHPTPIAIAPTTAEWHSDHAVFTQRCAGINGYAYDLAATVRCAEAMLTIDWRLTNTGAKPLVTRQYVHNFIRIGGHDVGPGYDLHFPYSPRVTGLASEQSVSDASIQFDQRIPRWVNLEIFSPDTYAGPNTLTVTQTTAKRSIHCGTSLPNYRTAVHARAGYVSPEQFVELRLAPQESVAWRRSWRFD